MNYASEKPPEAVLEGVNFKIFLGEHAPRPPRLWHALHAIPHPLGKFGQTGFCLLPTALIIHMISVLMLFPFSVALLCMAQIEWGRHGKEASMYICGSLG